MNKFLVKLGLEEKTIPEKVLFGYHVRSNMLGNLLFGGPAPYTLADLLAATDALSHAYDAALGGGVFLKATMHAKEEVFNVVMTAMGKYVDGIAQGSETTILSAGMEAKKQAEPAPVPERVTGLEALLGSHAGEIALEWDHMRFGRVYLIYMRADADAADAWRFVNVSFGTKYAVSGLESGKRYWFKVEVYGTAGKAEPSDPATSLAY